MATAQHLSEVAQALAAQGHEVTVVAGRRAYDNPDKLFPARENWRGIRIFRVFSTRFGKAAKWRRAADFASFIFTCCGRILFMRRHDVVLALTTPPLISFIGAWRAKLWGAKFCYWVMDFNPDEAIAAGWLRADSFTGKMLERMSRFSLRRADRIIALDRFMRDRIVAKGIASEKIAVIPPGALDGEAYFDAAGRERFRQAHGLADKFVVMYSGNHSPVHPLDTLLAAAEQLAADDAIRFCFVGGGSEFKRVKKWAAEGAWKNIVCLPYQPLNELSASLSAADAHVVVMGDAMLGLVHPCKIYNILAVGAPVLYIGPAPSHVTEILALEQSHPAASVRQGEAGRLAQEIRAMAQTGRTGPRTVPAVLTAQFGQAAVLPRLLAEII